MEKKVNRWLMLVLGSLVLLGAGVIYAWSVLNKGLPFQGVELSLCFTLTLCFFCIGGLISGLISGKTTLRFRLILAAVLTGGGFAVTAFHNQQVLLLYLGYGVLAGGGIGIVYNTVIAAVSGYFGDRKGLCSGVLMMAFGFSALLLGKLADALGSLETIGWQKTYLLYGAGLFVLLLAGAFLLKSPPKKEGKAQAAAGAEGEDISPKEMLKRASFWKLFVFFTLLAAVGSTAIGFGRKFYQSVGMEESAAVTAAGLLSIFNGLGRIVSGTLYDRLGMRKGQMLTSAVAITACALSLLGVLTGAPVLGLVGLSLCAFSYGFSPTMSAALVGSFYGMKYYSLNFPLLNMVLIPASFMSTLAAGLVEASGGSYLTTFCVLLGASLVGLGINWTIRKP